MGTWVRQGEGQGGAAQEATTEDNGAKTEGNQAAPETQPYVTLRHFTPLVRYFVAIPPYVRHFTRGG